MKLQLIKKDDSIIQGFETIIYTDPNQVNKINEIINNSCEYIIANTILDDFEIEQSNNIVGVLENKLRINGVLILSGNDSKILCNMLLSNKITVEDFSKVISDVKSISTAIDTMAKLESAGLKISDIKFNKYRYEITCVRERL